MRTKFIQLLICIFLGIFAFQIWYLTFIKIYSNKIYTDINDIPSHYAALVLGAQVRGDKPSYMLFERIKSATELAKTGKVQKLIMSGDNRFRNYNEPQVMLETAQKLGIPSDLMQADYAGRSTYESCFRAKYIFGQDKLIIVTQKYHLPRAIYLCEKLGIDAIGYEAPNNYGINLTNVTREILATVLAIYQILFEPRPVVGGDQIEI